MSPVLIPGVVSLAATCTATDPPFTPAVPKAVVTQVVTSTDTPDVAMLKAATPTEAPSTLYTCLAAILFFFTQAMIM